MRSMLYSVSLLWQLPGGYAGARGEGVPPHLEEDLVRLVLAEQLDGVAITIQKEARCESNREVNTCVPSWACAALQAHTPYICGMTAVPKMNRHVLGGGRDKYVHTRG